MKVLVVLGFAMIVISIIDPSSALVGADVMGQAAGGFSAGYEDGLNHPELEPQYRLALWPFLLVAAVIVVGFVSFLTWVIVADWRDAKGFEKYAKQLTERAERAAIEADVFRPVSEWVTEGEAVAIAENRP